LKYVSANRAMQETFNTNINLNIGSHWKVCNILYN